VIAILQITVQHPA